MSSGEHDSGQNPSGRGSSGQNSGADVLETNLERLFRISWHPLLPDARFVDALRERIEHELEHAQVAPSPLRTTARGDALQRRLRMAAAILALLGALAAAWALLRDPRATADARGLVARGYVAVRAASDTANWRAATDVEMVEGLAVADVGVRIVTPAVRAIRAAMDPNDALEIAPETEVAIGPRSADGAREIAMSGTQVRARHEDAGGPWRLVTPDGVVALERGRIAWSNVSNTSGASIGAAREQAPSGASSRVLLERGVAWLEGPLEGPLGSTLGSTVEARTPIVPGTAIWLARGRVVTAVAIVEPEREVVARTAAGTSVDEGSADPDGEPTEDPTAIDPHESALVGSLTVPSGAEFPPRFRVTLLRLVRLPEVSEPQSITFTNERVFRFSNLRPGLYDVFVEAAGFAVARAPGVELSAGAPTELSVELAAERTVHGFVREADTDAPIANAVVLAEALVPTQVVPFQVDVESEDWRAATRTAADGSFTLGGLGAQTANLRVSAVGFAAVWVADVATRAFDVVPAQRDLAGNAPPEIIALRVGGAVEGRIARPDGTSWPRARVIASRIGAGSFSERMSFGMASSASDGAYRIADLPPGDYVVLAFDPQAFGMPATRNFHIEGAEVVRVDVGPTDRRTRLVGVVRDADGQGIPDMDIMIGHESGVDANGTAWVSARTDAEGRYVFEGVDPRRYVVFVGRGLGASFAIVGEVDVPLAPEVRHDVESLRGSIGGRVLGPRGEPAGGAWIIIARSEDAGAAFVGRTQADAAGEFALEGLTPGSYAVTAHSAHVGEASVRIAPIEVALAPANADLQLRVGVPVRVIAVDAEGHPAPARNVRFTDDAGIVWQFTSDGRTDVDGVQSVPGVLPGRWHVRVDGAPEQNVDLELGAPRELTFRIATNSEASSKNSAERSAQPKDGER